MEHDFADDDAHSRRRIPLRFAIPVVIACVLSTAAAALAVGSVLAIPFAFALFPGAIPWVLGGSQVALVIAWGVSIRGTIASWRSETLEGRWVSRSSRSSRCRLSPTDAGC